MIITNEKLIGDLADSIVMRTHEVYQYDLNIANYEIILATHQESMPEHLAHLEGLPHEQAIQQCDPEDLAVISEVHQHKMASYLVISETVQRERANTILNALIAQLNSITTDEEYEAAIAAAVARRG